MSVCLFAEKFENFQVLLKLTYEKFKAAEKSNLSDCEKLYAKVNNGPLPQTESMEELSSLNEEY